MDNCVLPGKALKDFGGPILLDKFTNSLSFLKFLHEDMWVFLFLI